ncbi:hypothetical protein LTR50_005419 [Elasticomyces elasticus]|nr:hypothetical protein LTR50_005419 [Elasticomyces elasticus]
MAYDGVNPHTAADLLRQAMAQSLPSLVAPITRRQSRVETGFSLATRFAPATQPPHAIVMPPASPQSGFGTMDEDGRPPCYDATKPRRTI